jgi:HB1, ASXL, restriction endonuclease HTH domain
MNDQLNPYDAVISDLRAKRDQIDQAIKLLETLREGILIPGMGASPPPSLSNLVGHLSTKDGDMVAGTFHGMSIEAAVRKLLVMRKRTMGAQDLASDLRMGGLVLQSQTPAKTIASVLHRSFTNGGDIVRVGPGLWGLQEWFPNQRFNRKTAEE